MPRYSIYLISKLGITALATGIVIAQIDLRTKNVTAAMEKETAIDKLILDGLDEYKSLCQKTYGDSDMGKYGNKSIHNT